MLRLFHNSKNGFLLDGTVLLKTNQPIVMIKTNEMLTNPPREFVKKKTMSANSNQIIQNILIYSELDFDKRKIAKGIVMIIIAANKFG